MSDDNGETLGVLTEIKKIMFLILCYQIQIKEHLIAPLGPPTTLQDAMAEAAAFLRGMEDPY